MNERNELDSPEPPWSPDQPTGVPPDDDAEEDDEDEEDDEAESEAHPS